MNTTQVVRDLLGHLVDISFGSGFAKMEYERTINKVKNHDFRQYEQTLREVRKRSIDTAEEVGRLGAKVAKLSNLPVIMPAVVGRIASAEGKIGNLAQKQGIQTSYVYPDLSTSNYYFHLFTETITILSTFRI